MTPVIREAWLTDIVHIEGEGGPQRQGWSRKQLIAELARDKGSFLVAQLRGRHAGHAVAWQVADEVHIIDVHVELGARRQGLGRSLVERLVADCGSGPTLLEVHEANAGAIGLYRSMGFVEAGRRPAYYSDGAAAVLMTRGMEA